MGRASSGDQDGYNDTRLRDFDGATVCQEDDQVVDEEDHDRRAYDIICGAGTFAGTYDDFEIRVEKSAGESCGEKSGHEENIGTRSEEGCRKACKEGDRKAGREDCQS